MSYQATRLVDHAVQVTPAIDDVLSDLMLHTKFESWRYESEWRILVDLAETMPESDLYFYNFEPRFRLAEVILGSFCNLSVTDMRELLAADHPDAVTIKARMAFKFFKIVPKESTVPIVHNERAGSKKPGL